MNRTDYEIDDTIIAVSSPSAEKRVIIRISGPGTFDAVNRFFSPRLPRHTATLCKGKLRIDGDFEPACTAYVFCRPHSYTGQDMIEIHADISSIITETIIDRFLAAGLRTASPGEFTARAFFNGKIDLAQAEAVNEIICASNLYQLDAAEKLLAGKLVQATRAIHQDLIDLLSLFEAQLDFSEEDIELISSRDARERLDGIGRKLGALLSGNITFEAVIDLPSVGIAGLPNAGKSSLLNSLLGRDRSIVSDAHQTTRDVLSEICRIDETQFVLFDCAGLIVEPQTLIDQLAQATAVDALKNATRVIFCIDITKDDLTDDMAIYHTIQTDSVIPVATKADLVERKKRNAQIEKFNLAFQTCFLPISIKTGDGLEKLKDRIVTQLNALAVVPGTEAQSQSACALTARHRQSVTNALEQIEQADTPLAQDQIEIAAMMLRAAIGELTAIESEHLDETILDNIFAKFCIGK